MKRRENDFSNGEALRSWAVDLVNKGEDVPFMLRALEKSFERLRKRMGIFCMTKCKANILMWSHYADAHRGFCLEFKRRNPFFLRALPITKEDYSDKRPCLNLIEPLDNDDKMAKALLTNAIDWKYEQEWRIVDYDNGPGVQIFPQEALTGVILGCRISPENRNKIMNWCRVRDPQLAIFWAEVKEREFGVDIIPIDGK